MPYLITKQKINAQDTVYLSKLSYNEVGQLKQKQLHSTDGVTYKQSTKYAYNERGWLKNSASTEFSMKLGYDTLSSPQYNGNISTQLWGKANTYGNQFLYGYDKLNRLTSGVSTGIVMSEVVSYDVMGNINSLTRDNAFINNYSYIGNRLNQITGGFNSDFYVYDNNGNATHDGKNRLDVTYNLLNQPETITDPNAGEGITYAYSYDAMGKKLRKSNVPMESVVDYVDGIQYENGNIDFIQTQEGRAKRNGSGVYAYEYNLTDHLGNVRYSFDIYAGAVRDLQRDDYYAFGLNKPNSPPYGTNKYLYNGKELQQELRQYDYGARFYDPEIGRWNVPDPLAEKYFSLTQYQYGGNTPINTIDIGGKLFIFVNGFMPDDWFSKTDRMPNSYGGQYGNVVPRYTNIDRAFNSTDKYQYWGNIDDAYNRAFDDNNNLFINASYTPKSTAKLRYQEGISAGEDLIAKLTSGEMTLEDGETIKIVGHSQGAAFAAGIASVISRNKIYGGLLEFVDYISPHQPGDIKHPTNVKGRQFSTLSDKISSKGLIPKWITNSRYKKMEGVEQGLIREQYKGGYGGHAVDTWLNDLVNYWKSLGIKVNVIE